MISPKTFWWGFLLIKNLILYKSEWNASMCTVLRWFYKQLMCTKLKLKVILLNINACKGNEIYWNKYHSYGVIRVLESRLKNIRSCVISGIIWNSMLQYFIPCYEEKCDVLWLLIEFFFFCWEKISAKKLLHVSCNTGKCFQYVPEIAFHIFSYFQLLLGWKNKS